MKKYFLTVVYAIDDKPETVEAILAQRPWQAVARTDALADLEHAQADLQAATDGYNAARLEIESLQARVQEHVRSGKDWAMRVEALERTIDNLREENASLQQRDDDRHKEHSNALVEIARLKVAKADARHDIDDLTARDESQRIRIEELESQLYAIGAGGVEPLRKRECLHQIAEPGGSVERIMQLADDYAHAKLHHSHHLPLQKMPRWLLKEAVHKLAHKADTAPQPARQPLTEDRIVRIVRNLGWGQSDFDVDEVVELARAIERAHGIGSEE